MEVSFDQNWQKIIKITLQKGGRLVFINSRGPDNSPEWIQAVSELQLPVLSITAESLSKRHFLFGPEDLTFFWDADLLKTHHGNACVQGSRAFLGASGFDANWMDYHWRGISLAQWKDYWADFKVDSPAPETFSDLMPKPCLFLDRDDVIIENVPYNSDASQVRLLPGIAELIKGAHAQNFWVAMVTNQSGLARGKISWSEFKKVHQQTLHLLAQKGVWLDDCQWASALPQPELEAGLAGLSLRKPRAGMFQLVHQKLGVDFTASVMVGDSATDLIAAYGMSVGRLYLLASNKLEKQKEELAAFAKIHPDLTYQVAANLSEVRTLLNFFH